MQGGREAILGPDDVPVRPNATLDRHSTVPLYYQLAGALKRRLEAGVWSAGDRFPSEREISEEFGVSRMVIRPAMSLLAADGHIERIKGSGTFVRPAKRTVAVRGLADLLREPAEVADRLRILEVGERLIRPGVSEVFRLEELGPRIGRVMAVLESSQIETCLCDSYTSSDRAPWVTATARAMLTGEIPDAVQPRPDLSGGEMTVEPSFAGRWEASELSISPGDPILLLSLLQRGPEGPLEFARFTFRTDSARALVLTA